MFEELGAQNLGDVDPATVRADRRRLDQAVLGNLLGLNAEEQRRVYAALLSMMQARIIRGRPGATPSRSD